jgi:hypothetical protein
LAIAWTKRLMDKTLLNNTRMKYGGIFATLCMLRRRKPKMLKTISAKAR